MNFQLATIFFSEVLRAGSSDRPVKRQGAKPGGRGTMVVRLERMSQTVQALM